MAYACRYGRPTWNVLDMLPSDLGDYMDAVGHWIAQEAAAVKG